MARITEAAWHAADGRCCVCTRRLSREASPRFDLWAATVTSIGSRQVLLCSVDEDIAVHRGVYSHQQLAEVWDQHVAAVAARRQRRETGSTPAGRALVHPGAFGAGAEPKVFVKIWNDGDVPFTIDQVWFEVIPTVRLENPDRPLPAMLPAGELFETWVSKSQLDQAAEWAERGRVLLATGEVLHTTLNEHVPPAGFVGGPGPTIADVVIMLDSGAAEVDVEVSSSAAGRSSSNALESATAGMGLAVQQTDEQGWCLDGTVPGKARVLLHVATPDRLQVLNEEGAFRRSEDGRQVALPIWQDIGSFDHGAPGSNSEVLGLPLSSYSPEDIARELVRALRPSSEHS